MSRDTNILRKLEDKPTDAEIIEQLQAENKRLLQLIKRLTMYWQHTHQCGSRLYPPSPACCTCGLNELVKEIQQLPEPN